MRKLEKNVMPILAVVALLVIAAPTSLWASVAVPEIDPASGMSALALVAGAVMVIRGKFRK
jgi:hypothetical protein